MPSNQLVHEKHEVLYHYTNGEGLRGILESQTLWAHHYSHLNDTTEIQHLTNELARRLLPVAEKYLLESWNSGSHKVRRTISKSGGIAEAARLSAEDMSRKLYEITFGRTGGRQPFCQPFIVSFCSHAADQDYEQENGLLSQWKSYGRGGYAIVFDTLGLENLLRREGNEHLYFPLQIGDVVYEGDVETFQEEFSELVSICTNILENQASGKELELGDLAIEVSSSFPRYKHRAFKEEREVRIVASPMPHNILSQIREESEEPIDLQGMRLKQVMTRYVDQLEIKYIKLFNFDDGLPIRQIIVGPHKNQDSNYRIAEEITAPLGIKISRSKTPYIGQ